jgi:hypothetical protein
VCVKINKQSDRDRERERERVKKCFQGGEGVNGRVGVRWTK